MSCLIFNFQLLSELVYREYGFKVTAEALDAYTAVKVSYDGSIGSSTHRTGYALRFCYYRHTAGHLLS